MDTARPVLHRSASGSALISFLVANRGSTALHTACCGGAVRNRLRE
jgi:hypothetical protein